MSKHTPELESELEHIRQEFKNASHILACVNALAGVADPVEYMRRMGRLVEMVENALETMEWAKQDGGPNYRYTCEDLTCADSKLRTALAALEEVKP